MPGGEISYFSQFLDKSAEKFRRITTLPFLEIGCAKALGEPPEKVFRLADLLPALSGGEDETLRESIDILRNLPLDQRKEALRYLYQSGHTKMENNE